MRKVDRWYDLTKKVVALTGATGFIGPAYARSLAECGANVAVIDLDEARCQRLATELRDTYKTDPVALRLDITRKDDVDRAVNQIVERYGRIDVLVNNAAYHQLEHIVGGDEATLEEFPLNTWQRTIDVNLTGALLCCQ